MANFEDFLCQTEEKYHHLGVVKIRPPNEWLQTISVHSQETFNSKWVYPKIQNSHKLTEGIYRLTNNPLEQGDKKKRKKMSLKVNYFGCKLGIVDILLELFTQRYKKIVDSGGRYFYQVHAHALDSWVSTCTYSYGYQCLGIITSTYL